MLNNIKFEEKEKLLSTIFPTGENFISLHIGHIKRVREAATKVIFFSAPLLLELIGHIFLGDFL